MKTNDGLVLVIGATGKTGGRVVQRLHAQGRPVRLGSRAASIPFDWQRPDTWAAAMTGVNAMYVTYYPDLAIPGAVDTIKSFVAAAELAGVERIVFLSGRGEEEAQRAEEVVKASALKWTILRCSWFSQNFSENFLLEQVQAGEIVLPAANVGEPFVDADDIADVALAALSDDVHAGRLYELTGPRLLSFKEVIAEIAKAAGRDIRYVQITPDQYAAALKEMGLPADFQWLLNYLFSTVLDGRNAFTTGDVERVLGRPAREFRDYAQAVAATGVWH